MAQKELNNFGKFYTELLKKAKISNNKASKFILLEASQILYWMKTGQTPDRSLALIKAIKEHGGLTWEQVGAMIDKAYK